MTPRAEHRSKFPSFSCGAQAHGARAAFVLSGVFALGCSEQRAVDHVQATKPPAPEAQRREGAGASAPSAPTPEKAPAPPPPPPPRIYAKARFTWIQPEPRHSKGWLGYLSLGGSVALRGGSVEAARVAGSGGCDAWYAVEPHGYVCAGDTATLDPKDPVVVALAHDAPKVDSPWPYEYGESLGAPRYARVPSDQEQQRKEPYLNDHTQPAKAPVAEDGSTADDAWSGLGRWESSAPPLSLLPFSPRVREERGWVIPGSTVAYTRAFDAGGRSFLLTADKAIVPKDRVRPYPRSSFHGVKLGGDVKLPIAFFRKPDPPKFKKDADGKFVETGEHWSLHDWLMLTDEEEKVGKETFYATREPGVFVRASDASVPREAKQALPGKDKPGPKAGRRTWVEVSVLGGWMVAYEGATPVFATLISPGRGGIPYEGRDPVETASTPTGRFRVDGKFVTATMVSSTNDDIVHSEVQFVQNFHGPHALHAAYWHDGWGNPKSGGCVNLSPSDAKWLFAWSEPALPSDWYGMRALPSLGPSTAVWVHR